MEMRCRGCLRIFDRYALTHDGYCEECDTDTDNMTGMYVPISEIRQGDIVLNYGMRILIDGPAAVYPQHGAASLPTYVWPGLVLNADELCDKDSEAYDAYIACHLRGQWWEDRVPRPRKDDWPIQSNDLCRWSVLRPTTTTTTEKET